MISKMLLVLMLVRLQMRLGILRASITLVRVVGQRMLLAEQLPLMVATQSILLIPLGTDHQPMIS
jgi:hypothetical protein